MRSNHVPLGVSMVVMLAALANAGTRSTSDAGTYIAPGVLGAESRARAIPDGSGGAYVGFSTSFDWTAIARIGPDGAPDPAWSAHAVHGYENLGGEVFPVVIARSQPDNVWLFSDNAPTGAPLYGLIHPNWPADLDIVGSASSELFYTVAMALDDERTLIESLTFVNSHMFLRTGVLDTTGAISPWAPDIPLPGGLPSFWCSNASIPDGSGGAWTLASVQDINAGSDMDVVAVRFEADGRAAWSPPTRVVTQAVRRQALASICGDGAGGAYFAWADNRDLSVSQDVYALHMLPNGSIATGWTGNGKRITPFPGDQFQVKLAEDGVGGCWMVWTDSRSGLNQIYYTRLRGDGSPATGYPVGGRALCAAPGSQIEPAVVADDVGGFFCAWLDERSGNLDLYGQHIHATGVVMPGWDADGTALCTEPSPQQDPWLVLSSPNRAIVGWSDTRVISPRYYSMAMPADGAITDVGPSRGAGLRLVSSGSGRELEFSLSASAEGEIRLEVFDTSGRRVAEQRRQGPLSSERVRIPGGTLRPGLYLARAGQAGATAVSRALLIR